MAGKMKNKKSFTSDHSRQSNIALNPPAHKPIEIYVRLISGEKLPTESNQKNMFFCVFYVHDGTSKFRINKSTTKSYLQTPEVQSRSGTPKWDCFEEFPVKSEKDYLTIKVFRDRTKLGRLNIPAWEVPLERGQIFTLPVQTKNSAKPKAFAPTFQSSEGMVKVELYVSKHEAFSLPPSGPKRDKFLKAYLKAMMAMKDVVLLSTGKTETAATEMLNDGKESAILTFMPTTSPTASRTKVHIRGRGLGKSKNEIKSIHICGLDVTATLEHLNSTSLKVTTSFWKEGIGKIKIEFKDGKLVESKDHFEFIARDKESDMNSLAPGGTRASQSSLYTEFVPRTPSGGGRSTQQSSSKTKVDYTGEIDFAHHEGVLQRGTNDEMRSNYKKLIEQSKAQQRRLQESMQHREKLMMVIIEEAPHLMAKTKQVKKKDSDYYGVSEAPNSDAAAVNKEGGSNANSADNSYH